MNIQTARKTPAYQFKMYEKSPTDREQAGHLVSYGDF